VNLKVLGFGLCISLDKSSLLSCCSAKTSTGMSAAAHFQALFVWFENYCADLQDSIECPPLECMHACHTLRCLTQACHFSAETRSQYINHLLLACHADLTRLLRPMHIAMTVKMALASESAAEAR